jgi:lipoprotein-anchoring transpeptidase ErfK/SrfK
VKKRYYLQVVSLLLVIGISTILIVGQLYTMASGYFNTNSVKSFFSLSADENIDQNIAQAQAPIAVKSEIIQSNNSNYQYLLPQVPDVPKKTDAKPVVWSEPAPEGGGKIIEIVTSKQRFLVWQDGVLLHNYPTSTGKNETPTKKGHFTVLSKYDMAYGGKADQAWAMPYFIGFYVAGGTENGIHALPYINGRKEGPGSLGRTAVSHGCVRLSDTNAKIVYDWVEIGTTQVIVRN